MNNEKKTAVQRFSVEPKQNEEDGQDPEMRMSEELKRSWQVNVAGVKGVG